jgi:hypothetical protein
VLHGLKQGNEVLKEIHRELNVENVEKLLEETAEARAYQKVCACPSPRLMYHSDIDFGCHSRKLTTCLRTTFLWMRKKLSRQS